MKILLVEHRIEFNLSRGRTGGLPKNVHIMVKIDRANHRQVCKTPIYHKPDILNEIRLLSAPKIRPTSGLQFWGLIPA